jgi:glycerol-3-phosphate cytidylyltransferase
MKIGITCSTFDLLHAGHVIMLQECKDHCDYLICALQTDPTIDRQEKNKPVQSLVERYLQLNAVKWVDQIIPYSTESELEEIFRALPINVRIIGEDYMNKNFTAKDVCEERGIDIIFNKRQHNYSTSELRKRVSEKHTGVAEATKAGVSRKLDVTK